MEKTTSTALKFILKRPEDQSDTGNDSGNTGNNDNTGDNGNTGNNGDNGNTGNNGNTGGSNGDGNSNISPPTNDTTGNSNTSSSNSSTGTLTGTTTSYQSTGSTAYTADTSTIAVPNTGENSAAGAGNGSRPNSAFTPIFASLFLIAAVVIIVKTAIKQKKSHRNFSGGVSKFGFRPLQLSLVGSSTLALAFLGFSLISHAQSEDKAEAAGSMISISTLGTVEKEMKDHFDLDKLIYVAKDVVSINSSSSNYHLFMHAASDKLYLNGDNTSSNYFRPVEGSSDYNANFQDGSWGFHTVQGFLDGCTSDTEEVDLLNCAAVSWNAMPTTATEIAGFSAVQPSTGSFSSNTEVYFAANPSDNLANGTYSTEIIYTAIADEVPNPENPNPPSGDTPTVVHSMQDVNINDLPAGQTSTVSDARDGQEYTVYRWPATGTAGTDYPEGMAGYAIMTKDLALGYVTGGSITKDADLTLTTDNSASAGTITAGTDASDWSATYINNDEYKHPYYSYAAAQMVCPKGWHLPSEREYRLIGLFMERIHEGAITEAPYKFYPSGYFKPSDGLQDDFFHGYYWSSTQNNVLKSYGEYLKFAWDNNPWITDASKSYSMSVRCLKGVYMQDVKDGDLNTSARSVLVDKRDNQAYEVYRWPTTGTAGTDYPTDMAGYAIMVNDLSLGYNTGGFVTADADLVLSVADSAGVGTISFRADKSAWSTTNNDENLQYTNGPVTNKYDYSSHSYYSFSAAQIACPKGWRLPTKVEYDNIVTFMKAGGSAANGSATIQDSPYNFLYGGLFNNNGFNNNVGTTGQYWASVQYNASNGYHLNFTSSAIATGNAAKQTGQSVRCISELHTYMQDVSADSIDAGTTNVMYDKRDNQAYTIYRWPTTGTAGTDYPSGMAGYAIMTKDLALGYVTGGSITKGSNLTLTADNSAGAGTITGRTGTSDWSNTDSDDNLQYINGAGGTHDSHSYYSYGAAQKVCPKGWRLPTQVEQNNIMFFMGGYETAGSTKIGSAPYNFIYGGAFAPTGWTFVESTGYYWSSTQASATSGYLFYLNSSTLNPDANSKNIGMSVRCIAESSSTEPTTIADCSSTVHPTADTPCKMADNRAWILGNNGATITWNDAFTGATNADGHDATINSGICPEGYSAPKITDFDTLLQAYGAEPFTGTPGLREGYKETTGAMFNVLGSTGDYWSSTESGANIAFTLFVSDTNGARDTGTGTKTNANKILCYK